MLCMKLKFAQKLFLLSILLLLTACFCLIAYNYKNSYHECDLVKIRSIIDDLCDLYSKNIVHGSLCSSFCGKMRPYELVTCYNNYKKADFKGNNEVEDKWDDYKVVLEYKFNDPGVVKRKFSGDDVIILKSRHKYFYDFDQYTFDVEKMKSVQHLVDFLHTYIESTLNRNYGAGLKLDANSYQPYLLKLYDNYTFNLYDKAIADGDIKLTQRFILNFLSLMQQDEYLFYKFFAGKQNILQIYGTCGHLYAIEKADSLKMVLRDGLLMNKRRQIILDFLDLVEYYDRHAVTMPVQICDVKLDNFGLNKRSELKLIDTDMVHLDNTMFNGEVCRKHDDCNYFDCKSLCDTTSKTCLKHRVDNNLQVICEKIFLNKHFPQDGLLSGVEFKNSKLKSELDTALTKCVNAVFYNKSGSEMVKMGADMLVAKQMQQILNTNEFY